MHFGLGGQLGCTVKGGQYGGGGGWVEAKGRDAGREASGSPGEKGGKTGLCSGSWASRRNHSGWTSVKKRAEVSMGTGYPKSGNVGKMSGGEARMEFGWDTWVW